MKINMGVETHGATVALDDERQKIETPDESEIWDAPGQNGQAAHPELPDFYGTFLTEDEIRRPNPKKAALPKLELGDYLMRLTGTKPVEPNRHVRFIMNALLYQPDGGMYSRYLYGLNFFPEASTEGSRTATLSSTIGKLEEIANPFPEKPVIIRTGTRYSLFIAIAPSVEVVRISDDQLRERIQVTTTQNVKVQEADRVLAKSVTDEEEQPGVEDDIERHEFENVAYQGTIDFINGEAEDIPTFPTYQDLRKAKSALSSLAGNMTNDLQLERFKLVNELIMDFEKSELVAHAPEPKPKRVKPASSGTAVFSSETPHSWKEEANCLGVDPDLFFPERGASTREAKAVCRSCEVRVDCLEYALEHGEKFGIWGGLSERERRRVRRQRALERRTALGA